MQFHRLTTLELTNLINRGGLYTSPSILFLSEGGHYEKNHEKKGWSILN